jgi:hypothetical protein
MAYTTRRGTVAKKIQRGPGKHMVDSEIFCLADEVRYIQRRAAAHDSRIVSIRQLVLFSSESGCLDARSFRAPRRSPGERWGP